MVIESDEQDGYHTIEIVGGESKITVRTVTDLIHARERLK
jgi:hypothetical protein